MEIIFKGRQTDVPARFREYAAAKLNKLEKLDQKAIRVDVEVSVERNPRQASQKERVELTIRSRGPAIRAEAAAEDRLAALDLALAKLDSRLRRALDRRKNHHGTGGGAVTGASAPLPGAAGLGGTGPGGTGPGGAGRGGTGGRAGTRNASVARARRAGGAAWRGRRWGIAAAGGVLAVALVFGGLAFHMKQQLNEAQASSRAIAAVMNAPDATMMTMPATTRGTVSIVMSHQARALVLTAARLPALPSSQRYELWLTDRNGAHPAGMLPPPRAGMTAPVIVSGLRPGDTFAVSAEPASGSRHPTSRMILTVPLPS